MVFISAVLVPENWNFIPGWMDDIFARIRKSVSDKIFCFWRLQLFSESNFSKQWRNLQYILFTNAGSDFKLTRIMTLATLYTLHPHSILCLPLVTSKYRNIMPMSLHMIENIWYIMADVCVYLRLLVYLIFTGHWNCG